MGTLCSARDLILAIPRTVAKGIRSLPLADAKKNSAKLVAERLWAAGTMGAFFAALTRTVPVHARQIAWPGSWDLNLTLDHLGRYAYFLWFFVYFMASNIYNENHRPPTLKDLAFDVVQSVSALTAAVFLGFVVSGTDGTIYGPGHHTAAIVASNLAIIAITLSSLLIFGCDANERTFNSIRLSGLATSVIGLGIVWSRVFFLPLMGVQIAVLWIILGCFVTEAARA